MEFKTFWLLKYLQLIVNISKGQNLNIYNNYTNIYNIMNITVKLNQKIMINAKTCIIWTWTARFPEFIFSLLTEQMYLALNNRKFAQCIHINILLFLYCLK